MGGNMITETNLKDVLDRLGFAEFKSGDWRKSFPELASSYSPNVYDGAIGEYRGIIN